MSPTAASSPRMVEGAILVVKGGFTPRELAQQAQLHVRDVGAHLLGVVLNDVDVRHNGYYSGYYRYGATARPTDQAAKS